MIYQRNFVSIRIELTNGIDQLFSGCLKHDRSLCVECAYVGMCDGEAADDCDLMNLTEFETTLNNRLAKLDDQFSAISDILKAKKQVFTEMYRKDPRISHDEEVSCLLLANETFDPANLAKDLKEINKSNMNLKEISDAQERLLCGYLKLLEPDLKTDPNHIQEYFNVLYNYITSQNGIHLKVANLLKKNILYKLIHLALGTASKSLNYF